MKKTNHTLRRARSWIRSPRYHLLKAKDKLVGIDEDFFNQKRETYTPGDYRWLALTEAMYGDPRNQGVNSGADWGGDRMSPCYHNYGRTYAEFLVPILTDAAADDDFTVVEVGILNGSGLAIWCDLFPNARVIGMDLNLSNFEGNRAGLEALGAFQQNTPELYTIDQLDRSVVDHVLRDVLGESKVNVFIDDGHHSLESIEITFEGIKPYFADNYIGFIEDNYDTYDHLARRHPDCLWTTRGELAVVSNR